MDSLKIKVPKHLIIEELGHPEEYAEAVVVLENGMWTDIYNIDDQECYYTITNDDDLIQYLLENENKK